MSFCITLRNVALRCVDQVCTMEGAPTPAAIDEEDKISMRRLQHHTAQIRQPLNGGRELSQDRGQVAPLDGGDAVPQVSGRKLLQDGGQEGPQASAREGRRTKGRSSPKGGPRRPGAAAVEAALDRAPEHIMQALAIDARAKSPLPGKAVSESRPGLVFRNSK